MRSSETWVWEGSHDFSRRERALSRPALSEVASCFIRDRPTSDLSSSMETQILKSCSGEENRRISDMGFGKKTLIRAKGGVSWDGEETGERERGG